MRFLAACLSLSAALGGCATTQPTGPLPVVQGSYEPDYLYPWTVQIGGCRGTLISPKWVLTAAHCITGPGTTAMIRRRDPSGQDQYQERQSAPGGMIPHPDFQSSSAPNNDIALIRLATPFVIFPHAQVAGLPADARHVGVIGTVAGNSHEGPLPAGQLAVFRTAMPSWPYADDFEIRSTMDSGSLCPGDSGSGFVTVENGRAIVRGVASQGTINNCTTASGFLLDFVDVFHHRAWILDTMRVTDYLLDGNTRIRSSGRLARGTMGIACDNLEWSLAAWGPLYVRGVQEGVNCGNDEQQSVICTLESGQSDLKIGSFTMKTTAEDASVQTQSLPHTDTLAAFHGIRPHGAFREFDCVVIRDLIIDRPPVEPLDPHP